MNDWLKRHPMSGWRWFHWALFYACWTAVYFVGMYLVGLLTRHPRSLADRLGTAAVIGLLAMGLYYGLARKGKTQ